MWWRVTTTRKIPSSGGYKGGFWCYKIGPNCKNNISHAQNTSLYFGHLPLLFYQQPLQGKDPVVEVIKEVFSVIKLVKIVKKTFSTTSLYGYGGFGRNFNENSTQLKKMGGRRLLRMFFSSVRYSGFNAPVCTWIWHLRAVSVEWTHGDI